MHCLFLYQNFLVLVLLAAAAEPLWAQVAETLPTTEVVGQGHKRTGASSLLPALQHISSDDIKKLSSANPEEVIQLAPGMTVQSEDGYGLRPNIGMRGVHPHRSKKIIILEDGVPISPAPYSAPAAYYFPHVKRFESVDVIKGPGALAYGPNNIGGAIHMLTPAHRWARSGHFDVDAGSNGYYQGHAFYSDTFSGYSGMLGLTHTQTDGFKELPSGASTGFIKGDVYHKGAIEWVREGNRYEWNYKVAYADEDSHETYLGLSSKDFDKDPYKRYAASELDRMKWVHRSVQTGVRVETASGHLLEADVYQHRFHRNWHKFNSFGDRSRDINSILYGETAIDVYMQQVLAGLEDSVSPSGEDQIVIANNDRAFISEGLSLRSQWQVPSSFGSFEILHADLRWHMDEIVRNHSEQNFRMQSGALAEAQDQVSVLKNRDSAEAVSLYLSPELHFGTLKLLPAIRLEMIENKREDRFDGAPDITGSEDFSVFGLNSEWALADKLNLIFGAYQGYTVVGPGQSDDIKPEESMNYQLGIQVGRLPRYFSVLAFYHDYDNIKGTCTASAGCSNDDLDSESNGGAAEAVGVESLLGWHWQAAGLTFSVNVTHTYTRARFLSHTDSDNPEWGIGAIEPGDPLPYIPEHQGHLQLGVAKGAWAGHVRAHAQGQRYDQAVEEGRRTLEAWQTLSLGLDWRAHKALKVNLRMNNVTDEVYVSSMKPMGDRPGTPRTVIGGISLSL